MRIGGAACHRPAAAAVMERRHRQHEFDRRRPQLAGRSLGCSGWFCWTLPSANLREQNLPLLLTSLATLNVQRGLAAGTTKRQVDVALGRPKETNGMVWRSDLTRRWREIDAISDLAGALLGLDLQEIIESRNCFRAGQSCEADLAHL